MNKTNLNGEGGFTLVEVLIALVIFAVGVLGVAMMQLTAINGNSVANRVTQASVIASDQIEDMLSWNYGDQRLRESTNNTYTLKNGEKRTADGHRIADGGNYELVWDVRENTPEIRSKTIDITVIWQHKGRLKTLTLPMIKIDR
ncbi:MAG: type IV pilus modification protein PilV [Desulfuromonadaceae bacterium]|nr:type IV pilus modification protein PilV [Desulfuromonas sp.]MDY0184275.1 type IV pilus modification protein PilV [Desulfuromonadaceae bacterium]